MLSGDDSGLENVWYEICVQKQGQESVFWDVYDQTVWGIVETHLGRLPITERQAIWSQTRQGEDWLDDEDEYQRSEHIPWAQADVLEYIVEQLYGEACDWSNERIRAYLDRDWCDDP